MPVARPTHLEHELRETAEPDCTLRTRIVVLREVVDHALVLVDKSRGLPIETRWELLEEIHSLLNLAVLSAGSLQAELTPILSQYREDVRRSA